jgi:hypothetical protein
MGTSYAGKALVPYTLCALVATCGILLFANGVGARRRAHRHPRGRDQRKAVAPSSVRIGRPRLFSKSRL